jgi:zinc protease
MAFHVPAASSPDSPVLDMISTCLSAGRSSRLEQALVETGIASSVGSWNGAGIDPGLFVISATMMPDVDPSRAEQAVWELLDELATVDLTAGAIETLRTRARAADVLGSVSPLGRAFDLGLSMTMFGDPFMSDRNLEIIEAATPADVRRVAGEYFNSGSETVAVLVPTGGGYGMSREREELPTDVQEPTSIDYEGLDIPAGMLVAPTISISDGVATEALDNGFTVMVKEDHSFPVVSVSFAVPMGSFREEPEFAGLAGVTAEMMIRGTADLGYAEFHDRLESLGSYLRFGASSEYSSGSITLLAEDLDTALLTASDVMMHPAFRQEDFDQVIDEALAGVERGRENVFRMAGENLMRMMAARPEMARVPNEETLSAIAPNISFAFFQACSRPTGSCLVVVGDVDAEDVFERCRELFAGWEDPKSDLPPVVIPVFSDEPGGLRVETMPGRMQAAVSIGTPAPGRDSDDYIPFNVMNHILGRGIGSRLGHYVRDDQGLAYAVGSYVEALDERGVFIAYLSTRADYTEQAMESVIREAMRMTSEDVLEIELDLANSNAVGRNALSGMSYGGQAGYLVGTFMTGRPLDYDLMTLREQLELSPGDVREAAADWFTGEWFTSVAGGVDGELDPVAP